MTGLSSPAFPRTLRLLSAGLVLLLVILPASAADTVLRFANRDIATLRASLAGQTPAERALHIRQRIEQQPAHSTFPIELHPLTFQGKSGIALVRHGSILMGLFQDDLEADDPPLSVVAEQTRTNLQQALAARDLQEEPEHLAAGIGLSLLSTAGLGAALWGLHRVRRWCASRLNARNGTANQPPPMLKLILLNFELLLLSLSHFLFNLLLAYGWLTCILLQFPYTQPWGQRLGEAILSLAARFGDAILDAIPGLCTALAICVLTRLLQRGLHIFFTAIEQQHLALPGLHPETLGATRRLTGLMLWLFALSLAYPYLPGSDTAAFRGLSVFLGLMVSLGSAGIVNQAMSGLVLIYSRALRPGDWVQLGDEEGTVTALGPLSTKLINRLEQEITLPNAVITAGKIVNYSRLAEEHGMAISATVTIGYDAPWRQVHAMLELAASRTVAVRQDIPPQILQLALQDFYISYEILVHLNPDASKPDALNALHAEIQDVFNQFGVQIMSPHFVMQPPTHEVVAPADWYKAPARDPRPPDQNSTQSEP